ncbi:MAG: decaprenyl-phosphate phosphoribosyltransferase [Candidatus Daviesbacteria bacterium]|nr:decaprenyl-phosphate phosphoribosyltransferase [Candidatus Daviesbacteria bacterium]
MAKFLWGLIKTARPRQWIKNFALFAGLIFSGQLDNSNSLFIVTQAFIIFCGLSSATYFINDVFDINRDRQHPFKKRRPIASGLISPKVAITIAIVLIAILLPLSYRLNPSFFYAGLGYLILQLLYSAYLKSIILIDVIVIAAGFVLRIYAGIWVIDAHLNVWFLLSIIACALFLAIGKRRSELTLWRKEAGKQRETLLHYPENFLDILTAMFATSAWLTYALFAFQQPPIIIKPIFTGFFNIAAIPFIEAKYLMITVPLVLYGVMRYLYIIYEKREGESPERVILTDTPILATVILWLITIIVIIYYLGG